MGLFSVFKRKPRTRQASFTSYKSPRLSSRKPFVPKVNPIGGTAVGGDRRARRRSEKTVKFLTYVKIFVGMFGLGAALYAIFFTAIFEIQQIEVKGGEDTTQEQAAIKEELQQYLGNNLLFFQTSALENEFLSNYAYLKSIEIDRDFFHTVSVTVETYPAVANVRMEFDNGNNEFYVVNERGFIASIGTNLENLPLIVMDVTGTTIDLPTTQPTETPVEDPTVEGTPTTETPVVETSTDAAAPTETTPAPEKPTTEETSTEEDVTEEEVDTMPDEINEELIDQAMLTTLLETAESFEGKFDMEVLEIHYLKRAREMHLYTERYFSVWIDLTQDVDLQLAKLKKALTEINIYDAPLEYIDLRISGQNGEKVIYKLAE